jgi:hypothetical protein
LQEEWQTRMRELEGTRESVARLQQQLQAEIEQLAAQKSDLLPRAGSGSEGDSDEKSDHDLPNVADQKARQSLQRFQKLCRDAKRRAIGTR